jgi:HSP20 family protein
MTQFAIHWDPWRELDQLRGEMNRLLRDGRRPAIRRQAEFPAVNVWQNDQALIVTSELPGVATEDLELTVAGHTVTLRGRRDPSAVVEGENMHRRERWSEPFSRVIELPIDVDPQKAEASFDKGVLTLKLQRPEEQKPKKINVKSA